MSRVNLLILLAGSDFMETLNIIKVVLEEGFKYAILALGVYLSYSILDFPDL